MTLSANFTSNSVPFKFYSLCLTSLGLTCQRNNSLFQPLTSWPPSFLFVIPHVLEACEMKEFSCFMNRKRQISLTMVSLIIARVVLTILMLNAVVTVASPILFDLPIPICIPGIGGCKRSAHQGNFRKIMIQTQF